MPDCGAPTIPANGHNRAEQLKYARSQRGQRSQSTELMQARDLQRLTHKAAMALEADLIKAKSLADRKSVAVAIRQAVQAWEVSCDRVRIARGKPLPGSLRPESPKAKSPKLRSGSAWTETQEPKPEPPQTAG